MANTSRRRQPRGLSPCPCNYSPLQSALRTGERRLNCLASSSLRCDIARQSKHFDKFNKIGHGYQAMLITSDSVRTTQTEDGRIVLDIRRGQMFSLNVVGSKILELIEEGWDESRIVNEISRAYAMNIEVVRPDVCDFIEALRKHQIVQATDSVDAL